jgi:glycosyltransferase involved in cell wall biosynthesis
MRFSICILAYNSERYIEQCIESCLKQTHLPEEIIISDDCSTDFTYKIVTKVVSRSGYKGFKVFRQDINLGIVGNTRFLCDSASGDFLFFVAGDDYVLPTFLESYNYILRNIRSYQDVFIMVSSQFELIDNRLVEKKNSYREDKTFFKNALRKNGSFIKCGVSKKIICESFYPDFLGIWGDWAWDVDIAISSPNIKVYVNDVAGYVHRNGSGVSSSTIASEISLSYLRVSQYILQNYSEGIDFSDKLYIHAEVAYSKYKVSRSFIDFSIAFFLFVLNIGNYQTSVAFKSALIRFSPHNFFVK